MVDHLMPKFLGAHEIAPMFTFAEKFKYDPEEIARK